MEPDENPFEVQLSLTPILMLHVRRLIVLAEAAKPDDQSLLSASAIVFLQTTLEVMLDAAAFQYLPRSDYKQFTNRTLRDQLRFVDEVTNTHFLDARENAQDRHELDRLVTIRTNVIHGKGTNVRLKRQASGEVVNSDTNKPYGSMTIDQMLRQFWFFRLSPVDAKQMERAVTNYMTAISPGYLPNPSAKWRGE